MHSSSFLMFILPLAVSAAPTSQNANELLNNLFCKVNVVVISALQKDSAATSYCSSFLSIPTKTFTATATQTPTSVYTTVPATATADAVTTTLSFTETTITDFTTTETKVETATVTTTLTTSTSTITCLDSAYTASPVVGTVYKRGKEIAKPTYLPTNWASSAISTACSCLSFPTPSITSTVTQTLVPGTITLTTTDTVTPTSSTSQTTTATATNTITNTVTTTTTTTLTAYAVATTIASNGVAYRKYTHPYDANLVNSGFTSSYFKTKAVDFSGSLQSLTFSTPNWPSTSYITLADGRSFDSSQAALLLQGFYIAKQTGAYTFFTSAAIIDNYGYLWTGDKAYSTWSDSNTDYQVDRFDSYGSSITLNLSAGDAIPLTFLWANGGGPGQSHLSITSPDGSSTTNGAGYFVQACSSSTFA